MTNTSRSVRQAVHFALTAAHRQLLLRLLSRRHRRRSEPGRGPGIVVTVRVSHNRRMTFFDQSDYERRAVDIQQTASSELRRPAESAVDHRGISVRQLHQQHRHQHGQSRDLGSQRTLVLVDGRRMNPGGAGGVHRPRRCFQRSGPEPDSVGLIERVDVLTGGASAVYGGRGRGVVNFVLNTHYQGVKIDADYSFNNHKNNNQQDLAYLAAANQPLPQGTVNTGQTKNVQILAGANFADGKGNATTYFSYTNALPAVGYQFDHADAP